MINIKRKIYLNTVRKGFFSFYLVRGRVSLVYLFNAMFFSVGVDKVFLELSFVVGFFWWGVVFKG